MRRRLAWLVTLPLLLASSQLAHLLAYRAVYPEAHVRAAALLRTGHGYLSALPVVLGIAGAIALLALAAAVLDAARGRPVRDLPASAFALLPPLAYVLQEFLELSLRLGRPAWHVVAAPTFVPGVALQLPCALAAFVVARLLLRTAERLGHALAAVPPFAAPPSETFAYSEPPAGAPSRRPATRGPPLLSPA
jgi:hypothetical protein